MNFKKFILSATAVVALAVPALAQRGFDQFNVPKTLILAPTTSLTVNGGIGLITNAWQDVRILDGLGVLSIYASTNSANSGGTLNAIIQTSPDQTTISLLTNFALITVPTTIIYTNSANTNTTASDLWMLPGTYTNYSVTANLSAGTPLLPLPYTNGMPINALSTGNGLVMASADVDGNARYWRLIWQAGGTVTNFTAGASLTGVNVSPLK